MKGGTGFHGGLAAGALKGIAAPDLEDEVAPEGAHVACAAFGRGGDEEDLDGFGENGGRFGLGLGCTILEKSGEPLVPVEFDILRSAKVFRHVSGKA